MRLSYVGKLLMEFIGFARAHKAWWLLPILFLLGLAAILMASSQAAAPYIYTLF